MSPKSIFPQPSVSIKPDLMIFVGLMVTTLLIAFLHVHRLRLATVPLWAVEVCLIVLYFGHLTSGKKTVLYVLLLTLTLAVSLALWTGWDWIYSMRNAPVFE